MRRNKKENTIKELDKETVYSVLEFAHALSNIYYPHILSPDLVNTRLQEISYSPTLPTDVSLDDSLNDPKSHESDLRSFVEQYELISAPMRRIISYMASQLSLDLQYTVLNAKKKDYTSSAFAKDRDAVFEFLDRFDYNYHFRNIIKQILRNEICVCSVRDDGQTIVLQELPIQYCKITSKWDYGYLVDFNFYYFLLPGVSIDGYPSFFKEKYAELFSGSSNLNKYNPFMNPADRGNSQFVYWISLPPDVGWVFKFDPSLVVGVPYLSSLLPEFINQSTMRALQKNSYMASATKILAGSIPLLKEQGSKISSALALDPKTTGQFLSLVKNALTDAVKIAAAPLDQMSAISFDGDNEIYDSYLRSSLASSGLNTALFYTSKLKANAIESQLSFQSDSLIMEQQLYPQFNAFLNYWVNKRTNKFKYKFLFEGNSYYLNRGERFNNFLDLANLGIVLPQKLASALGLKPQDLYRMMEETNSTNFTNLLTPIISTYQQSSKNLDEGGRPRKDDRELTDSGEQTRSGGGNLARGGDI